MPTDSKNDIIIWAVIQGPVYSVGRNFTTSKIKELKKYSDETELVIKFDSTETLLNNIHQLKNRNINVIYSGWVKDCSDVLRQKIEHIGALVMLSDERDAPSFTHKNSEFTGPLSLNNNAKQFYSIIQGLKLIKHDLKSVVVLKIRSDMTINFDFLFLEIDKRKKEIMNAGILIQYFKCPRGFQSPNIWIPDFWFVSRGDVMQSVFTDLFHRSITHTSYSNNPHRDIGNAIIRYHWWHLPVVNEKRESLRQLIKNFFTKAQIMNVVVIIKDLKNRTFAYFVRKKMTVLDRKKLLIAAPRKLQHSIIWRGDLYARFLEKYPDEKTEPILKYGDTLDN